jgi:alkylation response protein AidB-like acyl-CoA dehydrogenase
MTSATVARPGSVEDTRTAFREWLVAEAAALEPFRELSRDLNETFRSLRLLQRLLYDAGWIRLGWAESLGGLGGAPILRAVVSEELAAAGYPPPFSFGTQVVLGPAVAQFAVASLSAEVLPRLLRGDETWCQGFSEPGAGSDLAALQVRAVEGPNGDWVVNGEKIWTSWAQFADRCVLLARTGALDSGHRGITAFFLDMNTPGIDLRPLVSMNGDQEFCSLYLDDVRIPTGRVLGAVNGGWAVAMFVLGCERGAAAWQRQAWLRARLDDLVAASPNLPDGVLGESFELISALRLLSRRTVRALSDGQDLRALPSLDKLAMSTSEKFLFDAALAGLPDRVLHGSDPASTSWRHDYFYSRASSIYGGAAEIQRNIIAERILGLPRS